MRSLTSGRSSTALKGISIYPATPEPVEPITISRSVSQPRVAIRPDSATLVFVGDVMLGRQVNVVMHKQADFAWPFVQTSSLLQSADLTIGNLESPLVEDCPFEGHSMRLCGDPASASGLAWAGFDGMGIANNHSHDYGSAGYSNTIKSLEAANLSPIGDAATLVRETQGIRVGVMAFEDTFTHPLQVNEVVPRIQQQARQVDVLIVMLHWGDEYHDTPSKEQTATGQAIIDAGADVIVGSHPHRTQPVEAYHGGLIFYSLGNFVFDQMWSEKTRLGNVVRLTLVRQGDAVQVDYELIPIKIFDYGQPDFFEPPLGQ